MLYKGVVVSKINNHYSIVYFCILVSIRWNKIRSHTEKKKNNKKKKKKKPQQISSICYYGFSVFQMYQQ